MGAYILNGIERGYNVMKRTEYFVPSSTSVVLTEENNVTCNTNRYQRMSYRTLYSYAFVNGFDITCFYHTPIKNKFDMKHLYGVLCRSQYSLVGIIAGWTIHGSNPGRGRNVSLLQNVQNSPGPHPAS